MAQVQSMRKKKNGYGDFIRREGKLQTKPIYGKPAPKDQSASMRKQFNTDASRKVISETQGRAAMKVKGYGH